MRVNPRDYFLPYQLDWLKDTSRFKIVEKSRRVGMTYVQAYEDVLDAGRADNSMDVWFSSADESAAREYIRYCEQWTRLFQMAAQQLDEEIIDESGGKAIKVFVIEFASGKRITAMSSNPKQFRSKGGKLVLDEFAFHEDQDAMWKAAVPIVTWGYPVRVLSTYNGKGNRYYRMVEEAKKGNAWRLHSTTIEQAVEQGLVSKILGHAASDAEKQAFLADCREAAGDEDTYNQEYLCIPVDEASAWLTWDLISANEHADAGKPELYAGGPCYVGWDIARRKHGSIIWVEEQVGDVAWTRKVITMFGASFDEQFTAYESVMDKDSPFDVVRSCIDQTGMGEVVVEKYVKKYGSRVEGVLFNAAVKLALANHIKQQYEDRKCRAPGTKAIRNAHHAVRKIVTAAGNARFDAEASELGHADEFWAHALALHAASKPKGKIEFQGLGRPRIAQDISQYQL